jgi:hypothetical protein
MAGRERPKAEALGYLEASAKAKSRSLRDDKQERQQQEQPQVLRLRGSLMRTTSLRMTRLWLGDIKQTAVKTEADPCGMTNKNGNSNCNCEKLQQRQRATAKYRELSTTQWTIRLSIASVEMTFVWEGRRLETTRANSNGNDKAAAATATTKQRHQLRR